MPTPLVVNGAPKLLLMAQPLKHPQSESVLSSNNINNGDILVLANPGTHMAIITETERQCHRNWIQKTVDRWIFIANGGTSTSALQ